MAADFTFVARVGRRPVDTVHGPGKNFSRARLARPAGAGEQVSMGYFVRIYRFLQGLRNVGLADDMGLHLRYNAIYAMSPFPSVYEKKQLTAAFTN